MYLTIRSDRVTDERVRALLEAGEYLDDDALDMIERAGEVVSDPEAYLTVAGVDGWYLDEDGHSHYVPAPDPELHQIATVTITEDAKAGGNVLYAGTYRVEMPADYDPALVTGEDILMDGQIVIVEQV